MQLNLKSTIIAVAATTASFASALQCANTGDPTTLLNACQCKANYNKDYFAWGYVVNDYTAGCDSPANWLCNTNTACDLYHTITDKTTILHKISQGNAKIINNPGWYDDHTILSMTRKRWLVLPGSYNKPTPVTGVEDVNHRRENSWNAAWQQRPALAQRIASAMGWSHTDSIEATLACAVNPPHMRSRHQLHFHVARAKLSLRKALTNKAKYTGQVPIATGVDKLFAMFVNSNNINSAFDMATKNFGPAAVAVGQPATKGADPGHHGLLVVPGEDGNGYYLVMGYDVHVENYLCDDISTTDPECAYNWRMQ